MGIDLDALRRQLPQRGLFGGGSWRWSPEPLRLTHGEARRMMALGHPLARFQQACDSIYRRSAAGALPGWIAAMLDAGKPPWLVREQRAEGVDCEFPRVIRPDLILADDGLRMTELDSVPGGIGVTAWLSQVYAAAGFDVLGGADGMIKGFRSLLPDGGVVLVSREAADYRPEMEWLADQLGEAWSVADAESHAPDGRAMYRFFELFDWQSVPCAQTVAEAAAEHRARITPPFKPHLEEKLWLALLWSPGLRQVWETSLRGSHLRRLRELTPFGWVLDPAPLPAHASLPRLDAHDWNEVAAFSQRERRLVLKISGFHETAWGSRGVVIGHDEAQDRWATHLRHALAQAHTQPWILQQFHEGRIVEHPVFRDDGTVERMRGRVRLCPYFFTDDQSITTFGGCLATLVPTDKKKIHGISDGVLMPCIVE